METQTKKKKVLSVVNDGAEIVAEHFKNQPLKPEPTEYAQQLKQKEQEPTVPKFQYIFSLVIHYAQGGVSVSTHESLPAIFDYLNNIQAKVFCFTVSMDSINPVKEDETV